LAGYVRPSHGRVEVLGFAPSRVAELRGRLGILPQDASLPAGDSVHDFLSHMARLQGLDRSRVGVAVRAVLAEVGAESFCRQRCGALSHGMTKRVALAQALLGDPELLLLDEPTAGLDPRSAYEVREMMRRRKGKTTLVVSSHNLTELEDLCDAAAILDRGGLVASDAMAGLTMASEQVRVSLAPGPVPLEALRQLPLCGRVELESAQRDLVVHFDSHSTDAETVIAQVLTVLLQSGARISGVTKGRGLERRVLDLTEGAPRGDDGGRA
jgi:ABC-type multidrug transport system ATPase subunit